MKRRRLPVKYAAQLAAHVQSMDEVREMSGSQLHPLHPQGETR
jgi:hypothetical protein